ncbi:MAG: 30S ribosomal protein S6 [Proteobacteria bacterium]|nr:30S ribosomal protein S6 [Pseudomonadota bacterium]MBU1738689.1 30S ribosomal protein S6 [Pseudomonadota bacterium]
MRRYETIIILKPTLGDDENQAVLDRAVGNIEADGGATIRVDKWGVKTLAYLIQKEKQGYYLYLLYSGTPEAVAEMERLLRIDDRVMKYLTVKLQDVYTHLPEDDLEISGPPAPPVSKILADDDDDSDDEDDA